MRFAVTQASVRVYARCTTSHVFGDTCPRVSHRVWINQGSPKPLERRRFHGTREEPNEEIERKRISASDVRDHPRGRAILHAVVIDRMNRAVEIVDLANHRVEGLVNWSWLIRVLGWSLIVKQGTMTRDLSTSDVENFYILFCLFIVFKDRNILVSQKSVQIRKECVFNVHVITRKI